MSKRTRLPAWLRPLIAAVTLLMTCPPASAFYWFGWPGSGREPTPSFRSVEVPRGETPVPTISKDEPPPGGKEPPPGIETPPSEEPPKETPEPCTLAIAGAGLAAVGVARWWAKRAAKR